MRVLVTGFGPFLKTVHNPSARLARSCGQPFEILPVSYAEASSFLASLDPSSFDALLMIGVAVGRRRVMPERFGRNHRGKTPDVEGTFEEGPIDPDGLGFVTSTLWTPALLDSIGGIPDLSVSHSAGSYLCNFITYEAIRRFPDKRVGFLHVPPFKQIPFATQKRVLRKILAAIEA